MTRLLCMIFTLIASLSQASEKEFVQTAGRCPTTQGCTLINQYMDECKQGKKNSCQNFSREFKSELKSYDCVLPSDKTSQARPFVPAVTLCSNFEELLGFLSRQKQMSARKVFASPALRRTLDGALAEEYLKKSIQLEQLLKKSRS